jgi:probable phosphoglycerate mutase
MTTTIVFIRHGQTDWNAGRRWQGHADIALNKIGRQQAALLAQRLRHWPIRTLYSSDLQRAADTARALGNALGLEPVLDVNWRERHVGDFEGLTTDEIKVQFPDIWETLRTGPLDPPGGEAQDEVLERAAAAFDSLVVHHHGEMTAVVSHGGIIHATVHYALGLPSSALGRLSFRGNTGISIIEVDEYLARLVCLNDTAHLENGAGPNALH